MLFRSVDKDDDRAMAMLQQMGLTSRYRKIDELLQQDLFEEIDYTKARGIREDMRQRGLEYIVQNIY